MAWKIQDFANEAASLRGYGESEILAPLPSLISFPVAHLAPVNFRDLESLPVIQTLSLTQTDTQCQESLKMAGRCCQQDMPVGGTLVSIVSDSTK